jgi:sec-independent protein translocase protein TatB
MLSMGIPPPLEAASLGLADSVILMVLAVVAIWPRRLPQISRQVGKLYEFRKVLKDFNFQMEEELWRAEGADRRKKEVERQRPLEFVAPSQSVVAPLPTDAVSPMRIGVTAEPTPAAVVNDKAHSDKSGATEQATDND